MGGLTLHVDRAQWDAHLGDIVASTPGLVPVAKGNGYGFGVARLAAEAARLGVGTLAVGTAAEVALARPHFGGDIVVLTPWRPGDGAPADDTIVTISRLEDVAALRRLTAEPRVIIEVLTSMRRHGVPPTRLDETLASLGGAYVEGWTIHLPMIAERRADEATRLAHAALNTRSDVPLWFSHVTAGEYRALGALGQTRLRMGTALWLAPGVRREVKATVLDVHPVARGERIGYWQRRMPQAGHVVVVAGGTAHGVALEAPTAASTWRQRAISLANGSLAAAGLARSPYTIGGEKRWFVEPPHMQSSLVFVPSGITPPQVGERVPVEVRLTTATVDDIVFD